MLWWPLKTQGGEFQGGPNEGSGHLIGCTPTGRVGESSQDNVWTGMHREG